MGGEKWGRKPSGIESPCFLSPLVFINFSPSSPSTLRLILPCSPFHSILLSLGPYGLNYPSSSPNLSPSIALSTRSFALVYADIQVFLLDPVTPSTYLLSLYCQRNSFHVLNWIRFSVHHNCVSASTFSPNAAPLQDHSCNGARSRVPLQLPSRLTLL